MINLTSYNKGSEIKAGRINVKVLRYIFMTLGANALMIVAVVGAYLTLTLSYSNAQKQLEDNEKSSMEYKSVQREANEFRSDLSVAKQILDKEVTYSKLILKIASVVPDDVVLDNLSLDSKTLGTPTTIQAKAKNAAAVEKFSKRFKAETGLFSDVRLESIDFNETSSPSDYPVSVSLGLTIKKEAL